MYCLKAVIATESVLRELAASLPGAGVLPLGHHLWLLPLTDAVADGQTDLAALVTACSAQGPLAYVEAEYFGGVGTQIAQVWDGERTVLGPLHLPEGHPPPATGTPISQALRQLGVVPGNHADEFAAAGLDRHRDTDDWLASADRPG